MAVSSITSTIVAAAEGSWIAASILAKYFLIGLIAKNIYQKTLTVENFLEDVKDSSELFVLTLILSGVLIKILGLSVTPVFQLFSELVALMYLGYLFWKF